MIRLRKHLTFANVLACVALFLALGGVGYAATEPAPVTQEIRDLKAENNALTKKFEALEKTLAGVTRDGSTLRFAGLNVQIDRGESDQKSGLGNLFIGREGREPEAKSRTGTENLVIGERNSFAGKGNLIVGLENEADSKYSLIAGVQNFNGGQFGVVTGSLNKNLAGHTGTVIGGYSNITSGSTDPVVIGGNSNEASAPGSVVIGGASNRATGLRALAAGGHYNNAEGEFSFARGGAAVHTTGREEVRP